MNRSVIFFRKEGYELGEVEDGSRFETNDITDYRAGKTRGQGNQQACHNADYPEGLMG